ncbi:MAG TPA: CPBP family intramembrane glutamic endopeptidase [Cyclobacteriaceae bacterium]|jgi:membrane protease YdiL (CAAX protease family)|nr:CPBP family intramembrane glutamic endopeptidase [Cyclobacteriaceae bacterium]
MNELREKPVWYTLILVLVSGAIGLVFGTAVGMLLGSMLYQGEGNFFEATRAYGDGNSALPMMVMQGVASVFSFLVFPLLAWSLIRKKTFTFFNTQPFLWYSVPLIIVVMLAFLVADSAIIEWNQGVHLPGFLKSFEDWARATEDDLARITKQLTQFQSVGDFLIGFVVVAVVAGVSEELLFRGIIQSELYRGTKNIHVAIWASAFLFSAIHFQFFGFVPRMLLGALFGYLYYWSGNIFVPMFAHLVNNGFLVIMIYLNQLGVIKVDVESTDAVAPWPVVAAFAVLSVGLIYYSKKFFDQKRTADGRQEI